VIPGAAAISLRDGTTIPSLGFGTLGITDRNPTKANIARTAAIVTLALEAGYRLLDTAQMYGNEQGVGEAIAASGIPRDELYITSKLANDNHCPTTCGGRSNRRLSTSSSTRLISS
jgi:2,5-diketo-D-gluconate reductase A